jgi:hypothetical protein
MISSFEKQAAVSELHLLEAKQDIEEKAKSIQESRIKLEQLQEAMQRSYSLFMIYKIITTSHLTSSADWKRS